MTNQLTAFITHKQKVLHTLKNDPIKMAELLPVLIEKVNLDHTKSFVQALQQPGLNIIAEIKRQSPSRGPLADIINPAELGLIYAAAGVSAISVLTDEHFAGTFSDLQQVATALATQRPAILCKDFIIDPLQIAQAKIAGANAVLLIVAVLQERTGEFLHICHQLGLEALVEVHNYKELMIALEREAKIIGINNRNLEDFSVNTNLALELINYLPARIIKVAESGIFTASLAKQYQQAGFHAVLVGEALVTAKDPSQLIKTMRGLHE